MVPSCVEGKRIDNAVVTVVRNGHVVPQATGARPKLQPKTQRSAGLTVSDFVSIINNVVCQVHNVTVTG